MKKKILFLFILLLCFTIAGCMNKKHNDNEVIDVIKNTNEITKYKENIIINYAVDDTSVTATGELKHDLTKKISAGNFKINYNDNVLEIEIYEFDGKIYLKDKSDKFYYINSSIQNLEKILNKNIDEKSINFINIKNDDNEKYDYYRYDVKLTKEDKKMIIDLGKKIYSLEKEPILIDKLNILRGIKFSDNIAYKSEIKLNTLLEKEFVKDTSVIGVANISSIIYDFKEEIKLDENIFINATELDNIKTIINSYLNNIQETEEVSNEIN